ncbi:Peroxidase 24 [Hibiscus syriacus]|uniref:Peroxidase n=1 Tax=Hibiscus syriacus TaxID=106335 RepID=A0A6A2XDD3_HIBSY|nr:Peroxidase 24 [Hibiscus syriacus]
MKMKTGNGIFIIVLSLTLFGIIDVCNAQKLRYNFYRKTCPRVEKIVREIIQNRTRNNPSLGAKLIRMQFHDCFVRGCDASVLLDKVNNSRAEKEAIPNQSLSGFDVIDEIKTAIEMACPQVVSCADIVALAARDAVSAPFRRSLWGVQLGRRDGRVSLANETNRNLPGPFANFSSLIQLFDRKGLDVNDLVVLSGAHTIGVSRCGAISRRLYNFTGNGDADPSLDRAYAQTLRTQCPNPASPTTTVEMDPGSSLSFDNHYYDILLQNKGLSMKKMAAIEVLTGNAGEIRQNCRVTNPV